MKHRPDDPFESWLHKDNQPTPSFVDACRWIAAELDAIDLALDRGASDGTMRDILLDVIDGLTEFANAKDASSAGPVSRTAFERQVFVVYRWDAHHNDWMSLKEFNVFQSCNIEDVRKQVVAFLNDNAPDTYGGKERESKLLVRLFTRSTRVVSRMLEEFQS